jgi:hypothetical protein
MCREEIDRTLSSGYKKEKNPKRKTEQQLKIQTMEWYLCWRITVYEGYDICIALSRSLSVSQKRKKEKKNPEKPRGIIALALSPLGNAP